MTIRWTTPLIERRPRGRRSIAFDVVVALAAFAFAELVGGPETRSTQGVVLTALAPSVLVWRRVAPAAVLATTLAIEIAIPLFGAVSTGISPLLALYTTAVLCDRRISLAGLVPTAVSALVLTLAGPGPEASLWQAITNALVVVGAWVLGAYVQTRRRYLHELQERAGQLERERDQLARIAVIEERTSIARELHDIVAHSVSVMLVAVRGARDVLHTSTAVADDTLARVEVTGEQSIAELRRILTVLREPEQTARSRPQPCISDIHDLIAEHEAAGLPVELEIVGAPRPLPGGIELSVYRIVQESLTNVLKHSRPAHVAVTLTFGDTGLEVEVLDDGIALAPSGPNTGHGIVGMRERIALLGGELQTGRRAEGGFRVTAKLPIEGAP